MAGRLSKREGLTTTLGCRAVSPYGTGAAVLKMVMARVEGRTWRLSNIGAEAAAATKSRMTPKMLGRPVHSVSRSKCGKMASQGDVPGCQARCKAVISAWFAGGSIEPCALLVSDG